MKKEIIEMINMYNKIIIHRHESPDPDALGSQGGLARLLKDTFPEKEVYVTGEEEPSLTFLLKMDTVEEKTYQGSLVIVCDTANQERISDKRYNLGDKIIKIDHHPNDEPYGDIVWVDTSASSTSEMITELFMEVQDEWNLTEESARLLYAGIVGDTGRFRFPNTTAKTLQYTAELIKIDFDRTELYTKMYEKPENLVRFQGRVLQDFEMRKSGLGISYLPQSLLKECKVSLNESSAVVNSFSEVEGIKAWVFFVENEDGSYRVRLRSKGPVINKVAAQFDGGGHPMAAGAKAKNTAETKEIISLLEKECLQYSFK
ncbi:bifunctional oligoribonuclease/PAP phosphatase NrnA [Thalassorhabdus alkalitolerans]